MHIRTALPEDAAFLTRVLYEAFNWTGEERLPLERMMADPAVSHYVDGWPAPGDFGVTAEDEADGPVGAAWARVFPAEHPGYGYVAPGVPELTLGVLPGHRGRGLGGALLDALVRQAAEAGVERLSLSVEDGNAAVRLYAARGFTTVGRSGDSDTMVLRLPSGKVAPS